MLILKGLKWAERKFKKLQLRFFSSASNHELLIQNQRVRSVRLLGGFNQIGISKAGRFSCTGLLDNQKVKIYECHSEEQVRLRQICEKSSFNGVSFPNLMAFDKKYVAEKWIHGLSFSKLSRSERTAYEHKLESFLNNLHTLELTTEEKSATHNSFCYLNDFLLSRLDPWLCFEDIGIFVDKWKQHYKEVSDLIPDRISHPDLHEENIIIEKQTDRIYIIDNELLGYGKGWILDHRNSLFANKKNSHKCLQTPEIEHFINITWALRCIGSDLVSNHIHRALALAKNWTESSI